MTKYQKKMTEEQEKITEEITNEAILFYDFLTDKILDYLHVRQNKMSTPAIIQASQHLLANFLDFFVRKNNLNDKETDLFLKEAGIYLVKLTKELIKRNKT